MTEVSSFIHLPSPSPTHPYIPDGFEQLQTNPHS
jgi:hypothetical protein